MTPPSEQTDTGPQRARITQRLLLAGELMARRDGAESISNTFREDIEFLLATVTALESRCATLEADRARLDWLESAMAAGNYPEFVEAEYVEHMLALPSGFSFGSVGGTSLRAAIDAAVAGEQLSAMTNLAAILPLIEVLADAASSPTTKTDG